MLQLQMMCSHIYWCVCEWVYLQVHQLVRLYKLFNLELLWDASRNDNLIEHINKLCNVMINIIIVCRASRKRVKSPVVKPGYGR